MTERRWAVKWTVLQIIGLLTATLAAFNWTVEAGLITLGCSLVFVGAGMES